MTDFRDLSRREIGLVVVGAILLALVMHWPLILNLGTDIPKDIGDPLPQAWQVAWGGHALAHQPLHFFEANQFWPLHDTLAFSDALLGYAPAGLIGSGPHAAVVRYDLLFLFAYGLAFLGAYLLGRELGLGPAGAAVAGAAYAFAPFRLEQDGHLHVISSGGIPLCLALFVRAYRLRHPAWMLAGWLVASWQLSLGFTLGLPLAYLLAIVALLAAVLWLRRGRPAIGRRLVTAAVAGAAIFIAVGVLMSRPYTRVADEHPEVKRTPAMVAAFSGQRSAFLAAPAENLFWGPATRTFRDRLRSVSEQTLFPGLLIVGLALLGLGWGALPGSLRLALALAVVLISLLALGFRLDGGVLWPYRVVYDLLPGWDAIRAPGRLVTFSSLGLAVLAGAGAEAVLRAASHRGLRGGGQVAASTLIVLLVLVEGRGLPFDPRDDQAQPRVPEPAASTAELAQPQLHLPAVSPDDNRQYLLWSTDGFPKIVNGRSSFNPRQIKSFIAGMRGFPSRKTVARLQRFGVRTVVLHLARTPNTPQAGAANAPIEGLPLSRARLPGLLVYGVGSRSAVSEGTAPPEPPVGSKDH